MWRWFLNDSSGAEGNNNFLLSVKACFRFILALFLLDDTAQIVAVQCHEEELSFPRRETERRCQKSVEILYIRRISPCEHGFIQTRGLVIVRTCCGVDLAGEDWNCGLLYCHFHEIAFSVYIFCNYFLHYI